MKIRKAVIPAAGLGTRMLPATKTVPKEMLPVVDKPLIQYIVEEAVASGIEDILIVTNRAKSAMDDYFDYHPELEERLVNAGKDHEVSVVRGTADLANIFYVRQKETKGLGHAILCARRFMGDEPFAVLLGDDIMRSKVPVTKQLIDVAEK
jgi:UTP--glucose-1-phosphate uridylyltransferase